MGAPNEFPPQPKCHERQGFMKPNENFTSPVTRLSLEQSCRVGQELTDGDRLLPVPGELRPVRSS